MRRLVVCNDGTWNSPDDKDRGKVKPTNITKISRAVIPYTDDKTSQIVFYDEGVGTGFGEKLIGGITGFGLSKNILESYRFLSHNYNAGDEIFIFGFSRGAFTSRSLVGFINKVGLVEKDDVFYLPQLYDLYKNEASEQDITNFYLEKNIQRNNPEIKFLGVFDTVGALGIPIGGINKLLSRWGVMKLQFHDLTLPSIVKSAYHALAIDERRVPFIPSLWDKAENNNTLMEQRWFAGVHSNIGGGYNPDGLANIALKYIIDKAVESNLVVDDSYLKFYRGVVETDIRDSMSAKYRVLGENIRQITLGDASNQVVDDSVAAKKNTDAGYRPVNA